MDLSRVLRIVSCGGLGWHTHRWCRPSLVAGGAPYFTELSFKVHALASAVVCMSHEHALGVCCCLACPMNMLLACRLLLSAPPKRVENLKSIHPPPLC